MNAAHQAAEHAVRDLVRAIHDHANAREHRRKPWLTGFARLAAAQQAAREEGNDGQRHEEGSEDREEHGGRQRADEVTGPFRQEEERQEGKQERCRAAEHGEPDLVGRGDGRLAARHALSDVARDVLDDDDRVVHQEAECDDEAGDRELVEREAEKVKRGESDRERQRYRDHDDPGGAEPEREQRQDDERDRDREIDLQA